MKSYKSFDDYLKKTTEFTDRFADKNLGQITAREFIEIITDPHTNQVFINNNRRILQDGHTWHEEEMTFGKWMDLYEAWIRMN